MRGRMSLQRVPRTLMSTRPAGKKAAAAASEPKSVQATNTPAPHRLLSSNHYWLHRPSRPYPSTCRLRQRRSPWWCHPHSRRPLDVRRRVMDSHPKRRPLPHSSCHRSLLGILTPWPPEKQRNGNAGIRTKSRRMRRSQSPAVLRFIPWQSH